MGALALFSYTNLLIAAVGIIALFVVKKSANLVFVLMSIFCLLLGFYALTAQPDNYTGMQMMAIAAAGAVIVALLLRFVFKRSVFFAKLLLCASAVVSLAMLLD